MLNLNNINGLRIFERIMPLCLALFFARTVFIGYKYLFFATFVPCLLYSAYMMFKRGVAIPKLKTLLLPILVIVLFFAHFSPFSNVVKEIVNITLIIYFIAFSKLYYADDKCDVFLKWIVRLTLFAGCLAITRFVLSKVGVLLPLSRVLFEGRGFSLVNDWNFYSLFFIISVILSTKLYTHNQITGFEHLAANIVAVINIIVNASRRAYVLYAIIIVVMCVCVIVKKYDFKKTLLYNTILVGFICAVGVYVLFWSYNPFMSQDTKYRCYKLYCLFVDNTADYFAFDNKQSRRYYKKHPRRSGDNLYYNGDLKQGLSGWEDGTPPEDGFFFGLIQTDDGGNAIRLRRGCYSGYWQISYAGRPIIYHKDVTYKLSFQYHVWEGNDRPFCVGWWVDEGDGYICDLPQTITIIDSVWKQCSVEYRFKEDHFNPESFLNSLQAGSSIDVKNIRLICDDTIGLPMYIDQLSDSVFNKYYSTGTTNYFTAPRTARWRYALELWQTRYDTKQKIFGQGFKYLEWYGEKFYNNPKRYDFPHNPIISSFLYSGIIGGIVYVIFLIMSVWLYWKRRKELGIFFIMYLCCMFFSMFSGSSHFSFPLFAFLSFVPFVEYKNDRENQSVGANSISV